MMYPRNYTITEEPVPKAVEPVMFRRLHQEAKIVNRTGTTAIAYIEKGKKILVLNSSEHIKGMADLLTLQQIPYRTFTGEELGHAGDIFAGMVFPDTQKGGPLKALNPKRRDLLQSTGRA